jgi:type II secretory pathway component GspD/PulD (secretin)
MRFLYWLALSALVACGGAPQLETRTFELKFLHGSEASDLIGPYVFLDRPSAKGAMSLAGNLLTVRETRDNLDRVARVLAQYDRPKPMVRLAFHLIAADGAAVHDSAIADIEGALRKLFRFRGYRLVEDGVVTATPGSVVSQQLGDYVLTADVRQVAGAGDSAVIEMGVNVRRFAIGFSTRVGVPAGKTAVLGNIGQDPRGTLILTVRPELINASP